LEELEMSGYLTAVMKIFCNSWSSKSWEIIENLYC